MKKYLIIAVFASSCIRLDRSQLREIRDEVKALRTDFSKNVNQVSRIDSFYRFNLKNAYESQIKRTDYGTVKPTVIDSLFRAKFYPRTKN